MTRLPPPHLLDPTLHAAGIFLVQCTVQGSRHTEVEPSHELVLDAVPEIGSTCLVVEQIKSIWKHCCTFGCLLVFLCY